MSFIKVNFFNKVSGTIAEMNDILLECFVKVLDFSFKYCVTGRYI